MRKLNIYQRFKIIVFFVVLVTMIMTVLIMGITIDKFTDSASRQGAMLYNRDIVGAVETYFSRETSLVLKLANTQSIVNWMHDENNASAKKEAFKELTAFNQIFQDANSYIAIDYSKNFYYIDPKTSLETFKSSGQLSTAIEDDIWYFKTIESQKDYLLNIDSDRFLNSLRVWINAKVTADDQVVGSVGTGLFLQPLLTTIFENQTNTSVKTIIINQFGAIQIDSKTSNINQNSFGDVLEVHKSIYNFSDDLKFNADLKNHLDAPNSQRLLKLNNNTYNYAAVSQIGDTNWHVITFYSKDAFYTLSNLMPLILMVTLLTGTMAFVINSLVGHIFVAPFKRLIESVERKEVYNEELLFGMDRNDPYGDLANSIEKMSLRLVGSIPVGMFLIDDDYNFIYANPYFLDQFHCIDKQTFQACFITNAQSLFANLEDYSKLKELFLSKDAIIAFECQFISFDGNLFWAELHINATKYINSKLSYQGILINIQGKKEYETKLFSMATTDSLTGLFNRHHFNEIVLDEIERCQRYGGPLSMIVFDLDDFKRVNDTYGHIVGDEVLVETASVAGSSLRATDVLARWGGEEFAVLLPGTNSEGAKQAAMKIRNKLERMDHNLVGVVTASFGVAQYLPGEPYLDWFDRVDQALFKSKSIGKNLVSIAPDNTSDSGVPSDQTDKNDLSS